MRTSRTTRLVLGGMALSIASGCATEAIHARWEPLTEEEVRAGLTPTGQLALLADPTTLASVEARLPALVETARFMGRFLTAVVGVAAADQSGAEAALPAGDNAPVRDGADTLGTSFFVAVACPGDQDAPVTDFSRGRVRLDSPELTSLELESLLAGGELLLSFQACAVGAFVLEGQLPGRYIVNLDSLSLPGGVTPDDKPLAALAVDASSLDVSGNYLPLGVVGFACGGQSPCHDDIRTVAELDAGELGTLRIGFRLTSVAWNGRQAIAVDVAGADGNARCTFEYYRAPPDAPGAAPSFTCTSG